MLDAAADFATRCYFAAMFSLMLRRRLRRHMLMPDADYFFDIADDIKPPPPIYDAAS